MNVILHRAREVVVDDERDLRYVGEGPAERIVDDEDLLASSGAIVARAELGHDGVTGGLAHVLVLWMKKRLARESRRGTRGEDERERASRWRECRACRKRLRPRRPRSRR